MSQYLPALPTTAFMFSDSSGSLHDNLIARLEIHILLRLLAAGDLLVVEHQNLVAAQNPDLRLVGEIPEAARIDQRFQHKVGTTSGKTPG